MTKIEKEAIINLALTITQSNAHSDKLHSNHVVSVLFAHILWNISKGYRVLPDDIDCLKNCLS